MNPRQAIVNIVLYQSLYMINSEIAVGISLFVFATALVLVRLAWFADADGL